MRVLFSYTISPYAAKARALLRYKGLAFEERIVHPLERGELARRSGQLRVPVLDDDGRVIPDSSRIARYLDERYPEPPLLPTSPALAARALLIEEWADEALPQVVQPVRWLIPKNRELTTARFRAAYPPGLKEDLRIGTVNCYLLWQMRRKFAAPLRSPRPGTLIRRLADVLDLVEGAVAETGWLAGPAPSVADFAAWGFLHFLDGLEGWEAVQARPALVRWLAAVAEAGSEARAATVGEPSPPATAPAGRGVHLPLVS
jgi:glutathione S-transferase